MRGTKLALILALLMIGVGFLEAKNSRPTVAVIPFDVIEESVEEGEANRIMMAFESRLANSGEVSQVDRSVVERVIREHSFRGHDWLNPEKMAELCRKMNTGWIVRGEIERFGTDILVMVSFYDIQAFRLVAGTYVRYSNRADPYVRIKPLVDGLLQSIRDSDIGLQASNHEAPAYGTYRIGDTGPAGGIVFYDKGFVSDGWRYLEAAPSGMEFKARWGAHERRVAGTETGIGSGKQNTRLIVEHLNSAGESGHAAQLVAGLNFGGFTDWFLPGRDELNLMYANLSQKGLGGFDTDGWYWSSSQYDNLNAWLQYFGNGRQYSFFGKTNTNSVRAIRAF